MIVFLPEKEHMISYDSKVKVGKSCDCLHCRHAPTSEKFMVKHRTNKRSRLSGKMSLRNGRDGEKSFGGFYLS